MVLFFQQIASIQSMGMIWLRQLERHNRQICAVPNQGMLANNVYFHCGHFNALIAFENILVSHHFETTKLLPQHCYVVLDFDPCVMKQRLYILSILY